MSTFETCHDEVKSNNLNLRRGAGDEDRFATIRHKPSGDVPQL